MAAITAQILIGHTNKLGNGMLPTHCLLLSEGSKPIWILKNLDILENHTSSINTIRWVPTEGNILEDALVMISISILKDGKLLDKAKKYFADLSKHLIDLREDISPSNLLELREISKELKYDYKIAITCFSGTSLEGKLDKLKEYSMDVEVCTPSYNRFYNPWIEKTVTKGSL
ncbi:hypothetical protein [Clostridium thermarum]|uniref:hypothetical protein n=1 Tax=Clostridium thermarum TaxID=1716543 RepID=UPI0013D48508|nr:hypothetical protein [Clostridium thermarum]